MAEARTIATNVFVMVEIFYLFNCRSLTCPFWSIGILSNPWVWVGSGAMLMLQMIFTYVPAFNRVFQTAPTGALEWLSIVAFAALCATIVEIEKRWRFSKASSFYPDQVTKEN